MKDLKNLLNIELHNEIRWLIEDYVGEFDLKIELVNEIIEKIKQSGIIRKSDEPEDDKVSERWARKFLKDCAYDNELIEGKIFILNQNNRIRKNAKEKLMDWIENNHLYNYNVKAEQINNAIEVRQILKQLIQNFEDEIRSEGI